jgi:hypothetical protein
VAAAPSRNKANQGFRPFVIDTGMPDTANEMV